MELCDQNYVKKQPSHLVRGTAKFFHKGNHYSCYQFKIKWGHLGASVGVCAWVCVCVCTHTASVHTNTSFIPPVPFPNIPTSPGPFFRVVCQRRVCGGACRRHCFTFQGADSRSAMRLVGHTCKKKPCLRIWHTQKSFSLSSSSDKYMFLSFFYFYWFFLVTIDVFSLRIFWLDWCHQFKQTVVLLPQQQVSV